VIPRGGVATVSGGTRALRGGVTSHDRPAEPDDLDARGVEPDGAEPAPDLADMLQDVPRARGPAATPLEYSPN